MTLIALLGAARLRVQIDVGIGDAVIPPPTWLDYPGLLDDFPRPRLRAYATETVIAEKFHAIVMLGLRNSRLKDYFDLHAIAHAGGSSQEDIGDAIAATFERRQTPVPTQMPVGLSDSFSQDPDKLAQWKAFLGKNRLDAPPLGIVIAEIGQLLKEPLVLARQKREIP